jgi:Na+/proline symporter
VLLALPVLIVKLLIGGALLAIAATGVPLVMPHIVEAICGPFFMQVTWLKDISRWQDFAGMAVGFLATILTVGVG